ncbi:DUF4157 domain-containing protein [Streptomyces sp. NPDC057499]|uniref:eCIS core domain-containing protein n=1 Tax=Streptomyces sp. NPDC057499 TaxID=3346150 RepID=UPI0036ADE171
MHANKQARTAEYKKPARATTRASVPDAELLAGPLALQSTSGNAAVVQMLRAAGHPWAQEEHRHDADCRHRQTGQAAQPAVQRSAVHDVLRTSGLPLDDATRTDMENRLGADFSDVRIHDDAAARASAAEVGARAYTSGNHVVIGDGGADSHTLAHELTHVIQQRQGPVAGTDNGNGLKVSDPADRYEREAEANATRVMAGPSPQAAVVRSAPSHEPSAHEHIQRAPTSFGVNNTDSMTAQQWENSGQSTFLSIMYKTGNDLIDLAVTKSNRSQTHGNEHAEDVALRMIRDNLGMFAPGQRNHLVLNVTKSPCTSTARGGLPTTSNKPTGCTEELIGLVTNGLQDAAGNRYDFQLELICRGLYTPRAQGRTQAEVLDASQVAVAAMKATGHITVSGDVRPAPSANRYEVGD